MSDRNPDNGRKRVDSCFVRLAVGAMAVALLALAPGCKPQEPGKPGSTIQEDDPRWDCRTMGNKQCGISHAHRTERGRQ